MQRTGREGRRSRKRKKREILFITAVVLVLALVLGLYSRQLRKDGDRYAEQAQHLQEQIDEETERASELEEENIFMQTREFIKKIAREKLGLVDPEDTIIRPSE